MEYSKFREDIFDKNRNIKNVFVKIASESVKEKYIRKKNPYKLEKTNMADKDGYILTIPFVRDDMYEDGEAVKELTGRALDKMDDVEIIKNNLDFPIERNDFFVSEAKYLMPFFLVDAIKRHAKAKKIEMKNIDVVIIGKDKFLTELIIDNIYLDINYLTILDELLINDFGRKIYEVFDDSGLNITVSQNRSVMRNADIVIDTGDRLLGLSDFKIRYMSKSYYISSFEMIFFLMCNEYKQMIRNKFEVVSVNYIKDHIKNMGIKFINL